MHYFISNYRTFRGGGNFVTGAYWEAFNFTDETMEALPHLADLGNVGFLFYTGLVERVFIFAKFYESQFTLAAKRRVAKPHTDLFRC